jgi:hypothetical protein
VSHGLIGIVVPPNFVYEVLSVPDQLWRRIEPDAVTAALYEVGTEVMEYLEETMAPFNEEPENEAWLEEDIYSYIGQDGNEVVEKYMTNKLGRWDYWLLGGRYTRRAEAYQGMTLETYLSQPDDALPFGIVYPSESSPRGVVWWDRWSEYQTFKGKGDEGNQEIRRHLSRLPKNATIVFADYHS